MSDNKYKVGMIITHPNKSEWGPGEIERVDGCIITIRNCKNGSTERFDSRFAHLKIIKDKIEADVNYFAKPDEVFSLKDLQKNPTLCPSRPGVYGWYFDEPPPYVPKNGCTPVKTGFWPFRTTLWLLYIGQADKLKDRIMKYHIGGGHYAQGTMSSLRLSLGCLLSDRFGLKLYYPPESFGEKDKKLNKWLEEHARIAWIETQYLDAMELGAIEKYTLPLNYKHSRYPIAKPLSDLRTAFRNIAKNSNRNPKKKDFRKAYKTFVEECRSLGIKK